MSWRTIRDNKSKQTYRTKMLATEEQWATKKAEIAKRNHVIIQEGSTPNTTDMSAKDGKPLASYWAVVEMP